MTTASASREQLHRIYRTMASIQACDEAIRDNVAKGRLIFFYFPVAGHEAIAATLSAVLQKDDYLAVTYRGFHHQLAKGVPFAAILGEMTGKATALHGGRSGAMHVCDPSIGMMMTSGIVGGTVPPAVGLACASQIRKDGRVTVCVLGDGAINQGAFHEAANLASVWKLPIVFLCENNQFAETTPTHHTYRGSITGRAAAYEIPAETVNGYDPSALFGPLSRAVARARSGDGPTLIDATCFRYWGHYFGDPMVTVPKDLLESERKKDPMESFTRHLISQHGFADEELSRIRSHAAEEARAVIEANISAPPVNPDGMLHEAYANPIAA
jgi:pyruvate dehydrogenase E1 component alpha subunit